jgi:hypothetical protein
MMTSIASHCLVVALLLPGCGSDSSDSNACAFLSGPPAMPPAADSTVQGIAEGGGLGKLDRLVGRFLRQEAVVYHGMIEARETQSPGGTAQTLPQQSAIAGLTRGNEELLGGEGFSGADVLIVHGVESGAYVQFSQVKEQPGVTWVGTILGDNSVGGDTTSCTDCTPAFAEFPAEISFESLTATSTIQVNDETGTPQDVTLEVAASVTLDAVAPCDLTFEDLILVNHGTGPLPFVQEGDEMILHDSGVAPIPPTAPGMCGGTAYTIDLYVNLSDLADYGVRNYEPGEVGVDCPP